MFKKKCLSAVLAVLLCIATVLPWIPVPAAGAALDNFDTNNDFKGLNLSVIGDSISTYYGVTNSSTYNPLYLSTSEATFGTYYGNTSHGDYSEVSQVKRADTWWQQTVDTLGMNLLVNNAWSGSFLLSDSAQSNTTEFGAAAYKSRCVNLHNGSTKPDIIAVYMGTNDIAYYSDRPVGTKADVDTAGERNALYTSVNNYATPSTAIEAYYIMLSRMIATYPNSEIYCMLPSICMNDMSSGRKGALNNFNAGVSYLVDYFAGLGRKVYLVDLNNNCGLVDDPVVRNYYYANNVHPDLAGMDMITSCLISEMMEHSNKAKGSAAYHKVSYNLTDAFVTTGLTHYAVEGKPFAIDLLPYVDNKDMDLTVTMMDTVTGKQAVIPGGGVRGNSVYIPNVTGPITITANGAGTNAYQWKSEQTDLATVSGNGLSCNDVNLVSGTYSAGNFDTVQYAMEEPVILQYDKPWVVEYQGGGTYAGGIMLFNKTADSPTLGNCYIHITQTNLFFGYRDSVGYNNSGISWATVASKLGSAAGSDIRNENLTIRFVNVPNGTSNSIVLYVNGVKIGTMDAVKMIGASATHASVGSINISGKDFAFHYMGSVSHSIQNCAINYIKVWENGEENMDTRTEFDSYRWELNSSRNALVSVEDETFTENYATMLGGSISGGNYSGAYYELEEEVVLMHNQPWSIRWESQGSWKDTGEGCLLFASTLDHKSLSAPYLYRRHDSELIAFGAWNGSKHANYGISLAEHGIDGTAKHTYELVNVVSGSSNMVYLYVDGVKLGAMNNYYLGGTSQGTTSDWISGKDFVFSYLGTTSFTIGNCSLEYLQVSTNCIHEYGSWTTVNANCTTAGSKTRTCGICGHVDKQVIPALGHSYNVKTVAGNCQQYAHVTYTCTACGHAYNTFADSLMSSWSATKPNVDASLIETKVQYRYSDFETTTSYSSSLPGYTQTGSVWDAASGVTGSVVYVPEWPEGIGSDTNLYATYCRTPMTNSETATRKTVVKSDTCTGYLYYHWCHSGAVESMPTKTGSFVNFHGYYSATDPQTYKFDPNDWSYRGADPGCTNSNWYFIADVHTQKYTTYSKLFTYQRWTDWSAWSDNAVTESDTRKVQTQVLYRYVTAEPGDHNYVNGVCSVCGEQEPVIIPAVALAGDFNEWNAMDAMVMNGTVGQKSFYLTPGTYEFKVIEDGTYLGNTGTIVDTTTTTSGIGWKMTDTGNCKLNVTIPGTFTFTYKTETDYLVITCDYDDLYLRGSFNDWETTNAMTDNGNRTYTTTVTLDAGTYTYKVGTSDWAASWPAEDQALDLKVKSEVTVTLTLKYNGNHTVTHTIVPLETAPTYTCELAALEVSCDAEVLLRMKMIIGEEIINNDKSYVVMTKDGEDTIFTAADLRAMGTDTKGRYVLEQGIASGEMTYPVTVKIYNGNGQLENIYDYVTGEIATSSTRSVLDYAERIFNLGTQEQKDLIAALVTYGGYSQLFFGTDSENPAYNVLTKCGMEIPSIEDITVDAFTQEISRTGDAIGITQTNNRVFLDSAIYLRSYFVLDEGKSIEDYTFTLTYSVNNREYTKELEPEYEEANNRYYVNIEDIAAAYLDYMYTITVTNGSGTYVVKTSAMAWAKLAMQATNDANQINMIKAMYFYNQAANTYFSK